MKSIYWANISACKYNDRFTQEESDIVKEEAELQKLQSQKKAAEYDKLRLLEEKNRLETIFDQKEQSKNRVERDYESKKCRLGQMPDAKSYYVVVTDYEDRGGLGLLDWLFGPKEVAREKKRYDYSEQERWKENERRIKNDYNHEKTKLVTQLCSLEQEISDTEQQISELSKSAQKDEARIERKKAIIREKIESLREKRLYAAKEYVQRQKNKLRNNVCEYLNNTLRPSLTEIINNEVVRIKGALCLEIRGLYADVSRTQKENLQQMLNQSRSDGGRQCESLERDVNEVLKLKNDLEEYLCRQQTQTC